MALASRTMAVVSLRTSTSSRRSCRQWASDVTCKATGRQATVFVRRFSARVGRSAPRASRNGPERKCPKLAEAKRSYGAISVRIFESNDIALANRASQLSLGWRQGTPHMVRGLAPMFFAKLVGLQRRLAIYGSPAMLPSTTKTIQGITLMARTTAPHFQYSATRYSNP